MSRSGSTLATELLKESAIDVDRHPGRLAAFQLAPIAPRRHSIVRHLTSITSRGHLVAFELAPIASGGTACLPCVPPPALSDGIQTRGQSAGPAPLVGASMAHERKHRLRVLHISDLQLRGPGDAEGWRRRRVLGEARERNLHDVVKDGYRSISSASRQWPPDEYGPATEFVKATLARFHVAKERFFVVPGNHHIHYFAGARPARCPRHRSSGWKRLRNPAEPRDAP